MKIINISRKVSFKLTIGISLLCIAFVYMTIALYAYTTANSYSIADFFSWYFSVFKRFLVNFEGYVVGIFIFFILPITLCMLFITNIVEKFKEIRKFNRKFNSSLNLKSVELLQGRVNFRFNRPQYNLTCSYADINSLKMVFHTILIGYEGRSYSTVSEIELNFKILNNKTFSISCKPLCMSHFIYSIVAYSRGMQHFSYKFKGSGGEIASIKERIENYGQRGLKQFLTSKEEVDFKLLSIAFFITGCIFLFAMVNLSELSLNDGSLFMLIPAAVFVFISLIFDVVLVVSKVCERMYGQK